MGKHIVILSVIFCFFTSCNGIFNGIYDKPDVPNQELPYGFAEINADGSGTLFIDTRNYEQWTCVSLRNKNVEVINMVNGEAEPPNWDFAIHHYDVKTNGGSAYETPYNSIEQLKDNGLPTQAVFTSDTTGRVIVDMSGMMEGNIVYYDAKINKVLSQWIDVDTGTMPPIYTLSGKVYVLRLADGTCAALLFKDFMDNSGVKGFITVKYLYPI